jgi:hypothetical protein
MFRLHGVPAIELKQCLPPKRESSTYDLSEFDLDNLNENLKLSTLHKQHQSAKQFSWSDEVSVFSNKNEYNPLFENKKRMRKLKKWIRREKG